MSNLLPISDHDNPHFKQRMRSRVRLRTLVISAAIIGIFLWVLFWSGLASNYAQYIPSKQLKTKPMLTTPTGVECTRSFDGKKPLNQFVVMIDAGSSGSRVHVYNFSNCARMPVLMHEEFKMIEPGLSSYSDPQLAAKSLDPLLDIAVNTVPKHLQKCTPIAVMATAGLRKLGEEKSMEILTAVRQNLEQQYPFPVVDDGVQIMSGEDEGVYAWVTANYLLGNIGTADKTPTVAVFDLGGGSTQIVFEPTFKDPKEQLSPGDHRRELNFGGRKFVLYQHSYLGYGLNSAVEQINQAVVQSQKGPRSEYISPCIPPNVSVPLKVKVPDGTATLNGDKLVEKVVTFKGPVVSAPLQCRKIIEQVLNKDSMCTLPPCSFAGIHQPRLSTAFPVDSDMYVFSFFYDRTSPLGMPSTFSLSELSDLTSMVCRGADTYSAFEVFPGAVDALKANPLWCTELSYMTTLLRTGYELKSHRDVKIAKKINGNELGWCLGASLPLLDHTNWKCKS